MAVVPGLRWSPPTRDDGEAWLDLLAAIESVDQRCEVYDTDDLDDEWGSVWAHPATDATFVWDGDALVAFGWLRSMPGQREAHQVWCWGGVHPVRRGEGIGRLLLSRQLDQAAAVAARFDPTLPTHVHVDVHQGQAGAAALALRLGFRPVREFLEIARPTSDPIDPVAPPAGLHAAPWTAELDESTRLAHSEAFADHWGSEPRTAEEWRQWYTGHRSFRADLSLVAVDDATGDVVGYVLAATYPQDWAAGVPVEVWINSVGTRPAWRRRGVARWLLTEVLGLVAASDEGFERAILGVDADNPSGAVSLYRSLGFTDVRTVTTLRHTPEDA